MYRPNTQRHISAAVNKQSGRKTLETLRTELRQKCRDSIKANRRNAFTERRKIVDIESKHNFLNHVRREVENIESDIVLQNKIYEELKAEVDYWIEEEINYLTNLEKDVTICPICRVYQLEAAYGTTLITCICGVKLNYPPGLTVMKQSLQRIVSDHETKCQNDLNFYSDQSVEDVSLNSLNAVCFLCDFFCAVVS